MTTIPSSTKINQTVVIGEYCVIGENVKLGKNVKIENYVQIRDNVEIGDNVAIKEFTRIDKGAKIGNNVQIRGHSVICSDMIIEGGNDLGHGLWCTNHIKLAKFSKEEDAVKPPIIKKGACVAVGVVLMPGVVLGENCRVGAGSVVRKDVPANKVFYTKHELEFLREIREEEKYRIE